MSKASVSIQREERKRTFDDIGSSSNVVSFHIPDGGSCKKSSTTNNAQVCTQKRKCTSARFVRCEINGGIICSNV